MERGHWRVAGVLLGFAVAPLVACDRAPLPSGATPSRPDDVTPEAALKLEAGSYLVAIDTPRRTYLDYVKMERAGAWRPAVDGWPLLARWDKETTVLALRYVPFAPGQSLTVAEIQALLPATAPAPRSLDVAAAPFGAEPRPADATRSIQAALDSARAVASRDRPVDVVVPQGTFDHAGVLEVGPFVRLRGTGGELHATNPQSSAVHLAGDGSGALFLKLTSSATARGSAAASSGIWVGPRSPGEGAVVRDTLVIGNDVAQTMGAHVLGVAEVGGLWAFNAAHDGFADFFHHTAASSDCQVVGNRATGSATRGDDFYAFVGYVRDGDPVHHCDCLANWGRGGPARGISVVGGGFIDVEDNDVARTQAAGIYIARERAYDTYGTFDVTVRGNRVAESNLGSTHDGLLAYADDPASSAPSRTFGAVPDAVRRLVVEGNVFADIARGKGHGFGIEVRDSCAEGAVTDNVVRNSAAPGIVVKGTGFTVSGNDATAP